MKMPIRIKLLLAAAAALALTTSADAAVTRTVNSNADPGDGTCDATECTLREAIAAASSGDTIDFSVTGTITVASELLIDKSLTLTGPGAANLALDGNNAVRVLRIEGSGITVTVSGLTFTRGGGTLPGGGIYIRSTTAGGLVTIDNCIVTENRISTEGYQGVGAGLYTESKGAVVLTNSTFSKNSSFGTIPGYGGGVAHYGGGTLQMSNCQVVDNLLEATSVVFGGGVYINNYIYNSNVPAGAVTITDCNISNNTAGATTGFSEGTGGGLYAGVDGPLTVTRTTISNNRTRGTAANSDTKGGGVFTSAAPARGSCTISDSTISDNVVTSAGAGSGGAIYNYGEVNAPPIVIRNSTLSGNTVTSTGTFSTRRPDPLTHGGAIYNANAGEIDIADSRITGNSVTGLSNSRGGAIKNDAFGEITVTNCTISENAAKRAGDTDITHSSGGAISSLGTNESRVTITRSSIWGNSVIAGTRGGFGGAVDMQGGIVTITDTTIGNNVVTAPDAVAAYGGGIYLLNYNQGTGFVPAALNLRNSTIAGNAAGDGGEDASGGGVYNGIEANTGSAVVNTSNSIIALNEANDASSDVAGVITSGGFNLIGNGDGSTGLSNGTNGDQIGTTASPIDPKLSALGNYGGSTLTYALLAESPALDAGDPNFDATTLPTDQRGFPRVRHGRLDIGAYEAPPAPVITAPADNAGTGPTPTIAGTAEPGSTVVLTITGASSSVNVTTTANSNGAFSVNAPSLAEGTYTVSGAQGFSTTEIALAPFPSNTRTFIVDATPPVISGTPANITAEATGPGGAPVTYTSPSANDNVDGPVTVTCAPASGSTFALGTTSVVCSATDTAGNTATVSFNVTVRDTTAPAFGNVPANITTTATTPDGAVVTYNSPTATDAVSGNVAVTCTPSSGSTFPIGTTTVTCTASDSAGNSAQASFTVTVEAASPTPAPTASPSASPSPSPGPSATPAQPVNIATRVNVGTGGNVMIGGFIITGSAPKKVIVRGIGPSADVEGALADPILELNGPEGFSTVTNDNWDETQKDDVEESGLAPEDPRESAIVITLEPGAYTAIVRGNGESTGIGLVEIYDLSLGAPSQLANLSTRGFVETGDNVIIGGFILGGSAGDEVDVIIRAIGPSLAESGVSNALADPALDVRDKNGNPVASNDDWQSDTRAGDVASSGVAPSNELESALYLSLPPGEYTTIVSGKDGATGVGLVEIYHLQ